VDEAPEKIENREPYDLAGTLTGGAAQPFHPNSLPGGVHVLYAKVVKRDGTAEIL
jgi:hypothetical protein